MSVLLCFLGGAAIVLFWFFMWPKVYGPLSEFIVGNQNVDSVLFISLLLSFALITSLVRVAFLAFDTVSRDLRLLLASAPLTRLERAAIQVVPDLVSSTIVALFLGSLAVIAYSAVSPEVSILEAIFLCLSIISIVGSLSALIESILTRIIRNNQTARAVASVLIMSGLSAIMIMIIHDIQISLENNATTAFGLLLFRLSSIEIIGISCLAIILALLLWLIFAGFTEREVFIIRRRRILLHSFSGRVPVLAILSYWRNSSNKMAIVSMIIVVVLGFFLEQETKISIGSLFVTWAGVFLATITALGSYGDFLQVRWRVLASPTRSFIAAIQWIVSQAFLVVIFSVLAVGFTYLVQPGVFSMWGMEDTWKLASGYCVGIGVGMFSGRLIPFTEGDILSMGASGLLASLGIVGLLVFSSWITQGNVLDQTFVAIVLCILCMGATLAFERNAESLRRT